MYTPSSNSSLHTTSTRRSTPFAQEHKVLSLRCDRAWLELFEDAVLIFTLNKFPIAVQMTPPSFFCVVIIIVIGLGFKRDFFRGVPAPKTM
jgi:hypothetical protein